MRCYGGSRGRASQACSRRGGRKAQYGHAGHQTTPPYSLTNLSLSHTVLLHSLFCFNCFLSNVVSLVHLLPTNFLVTLASLKKCSSLENCHNNDLNIPQKNTFSACHVEMIGTVSNKCTNWFILSWVLTLWCPVMLWRRLAAVCGHLRVVTRCSCGNPCNASDEGWEGYKNTGFHRSLKKSLIESSRLVIIIFIIIITFTIT